MIKKITIPYKSNELTLLVQFDGEFGSVDSFHDRDLQDRAFYNRYDLIDIESETDFNNFIKKYQKKAILIK